FRTWGGKRKGAGRKRAGAPRMPHVARPKLSRHHPVHVTMRVRPEVGQLRRRRAYQCVQWVLLRMAPREDFRVVQVSIQRTHLHLIVEARDERALSRGVRAFEISAARRLNRACGRRGIVFGDRYHAEQLKTPRQVRNAYAYVLNNWRKHREDRGRRWRIDPYSSAIAFDGWKDHERPFRWPRDYEILPVKVARSWLLTDGWRRHGRIDTRERPGTRASA
ncbi:MAG TPA: transposase, partial [Kofleriaceae bacterium]|nr:transposase [Kofleriaceae bacterium]